MPNISSTNINQTSFRGVIAVLTFSASYYDYFEIELWNANATTFYYANNWTDSSSNNYSYIDFSGLSPGTTYTIKGFVKPSGGGRTHVGTITVTTSSPSIPSPGGVGSVSTTSYDTSLYISWTSATNASWYDVTVRVGNSGGTLVYTNSSVFSTGITVSGLSSGTTYWIEVKAGNGTGNGPASATTATTTTPPSPSNLQTTPTSNSVVLTWDALSGASSYSAEIYLQGGSTPVKSSYSFTGTTVSFSGLTPNIDYTAKVYADIGVASYKGFKTSANSRPSNWSWVSLVSSRATNPNSTYNGVIPLAIVNASEWNDFTTRINQFRTYKGLGMATFTSASSGGAFTPTMYSQAVNAISPMATVNQTGGFYSKLVALKNALNSIT
jgi:hypothetical protein